MFFEQPAQILALIRSSQEVQIGGPDRDGRTRSRGKVPALAQLGLGFAAIYLIWGSTYLAIRYAVETIPPLLMMGVRHLIAGVLVFGWVRARGVPAPSLRQWGGAGMAGARCCFSVAMACWRGLSKKCLPDSRRCSAQPCRCGLSCSPAWMAASPGSVGERGREPCWASPGWLG